MEKFSYLKSANADYIDQVYALYLKDPFSVEESWRYFFEGIELGESNGSLANGHSGQTDGTAKSTDLGAESKVVELVQTYRAYGRLMAGVDPLNAPPSSHPVLELSKFGLSAQDLDQSFAAGRLIGLGSAKLKDIIAALKDTYCRTIGVELGHINDPQVREWVQTKLESTRSRDSSLDAESRKFILKRLSESETFERFLHTRYVAQKRFSVEGGEAVIPSLDAMIETLADQGAKEVVLGMAHRGRLNVLTNIFGKKPEMIFTEFEGNYKLDPSHGEGDVKYHKGYSLDFKTRKGKEIHLSLTSNPSHLEFVNPVVEGIVRAKQQMRQDQTRAQVVPILIHGDAAFAGQGVCYETLNLSQLEGYKTGGTLHIVINNQVGFTADPWESRSTLYCTDLAKMMDAPIFHVNGDDIEAVWFLSKLCAEFRQKFKSDVFIDLICYRKHGHNESDEPAFTQPILYKKIKAQASPREVYAQTLIKTGVINEQQAQATIDELNANFTEAQSKIKAKAADPHPSVFEGAWKGFKAPHSLDELFVKANTAVTEKAIKELAEKINHMPSSFHLHPKLQRFFEARLKAVQEGKGIDWGNAETLAYASLLAEGTPIRLSGQDAGRGTFTHRHAVLGDHETGEKYIPLAKISDQQGPFEVYNSHLSETGVLGFEYGYALASPRSLVIWEAQFGDFANGAQVIIDQFITTSESKWQRMNGLVLLLPHGFEGQGPEHSSARLERFLTLCGKENIQVCNLSTPAQIFHALRRQIKRDFRKPLIIMSPKSLLRLPAAISNLSDLTQGGFQEVIDDTAVDANSVERVLLCTGKVYYELLAERIAKKKNNTAIVRVEQLYPWPKAQLAQILKRFGKAKDLVWAQEEPRNMGAWPFVCNMWNGGLDDFQALVDRRPIRYVGRAIAAAPAVGSAKLHESEQKELIEKSFA